MRLFLVAALACGTAGAADLPNLRELAQSEFRKVAEDLGAAAAYKGVTPAGGLGTLGFDVGLEVTETKLERTDLFRRAGSGESRLMVPKVHVSKGLPFGLDVGAFVGGVPQYDAGLFGANLKWAVVDDGIAMPAIAIRASATRTNGLGPVEIDTAALDIMVSKKFVLVTPYAGAGTVRVDAKAPGAGLAGERFNKTRWFGGVNVNLVAANLAAELEQLGDNTSLSVKVGFRF